MNTENQIDVWKLSDGSTSCYYDDQQEAIDEMAACSDSGITGMSITKEEMSRYRFNHLPEFEGF